MSRKVLAAVALCLLVFGSGCLGFFQGPQDVSDEQLRQEPPEGYQYDWESDRAVHIQLTENADFVAVYEVPANRSQITLYRNDGFGGTNAIPVRAVRLRYADGTTIRGDEFGEYGGGVERTRDEVIITLPDDADNDTTVQLAFTSSSSPKRFSLPTYDWVAGDSYAVVLPPNRSVDLPVFGNVRPGGYEASERGGRTNIVWSEVGGRSVSVQYYLERDIFVFGAIAAALTLVAAVGLAYYRRQIEELRERREEVGVDVETEDDDFGDDPPPGMG